MKKLKFDSFYSHSAQQPSSEAIISQNEWKKGQKKKNGEKTRILIYQNIILLPVVQGFMASFFCVKWSYSTPCNCVILWYLPVVQGLVWILKPKFSCNNMWPNQILNLRISLWDSGIPKNKIYYILLEVVVVRQEIVFICSLVGCILLLKKSFCLSLGEDGVFILSILPLSPFTWVLQRRSCPCDSEEVFSNPQVHQTKTVYVLLLLEDFLDE